MAVLDFAGIQNLMLDRAQANVSTDAPISATEIARFINEAYADVWEMSGGRLKETDHATAWLRSATDTSGILFGKLTDISEIDTLFCVSADLFGKDGDSVVVQRELPYINFLRARGSDGTYGTKIKVFAATRIPAGANLASNVAASWVASTNKVTSTTAGDFATLQPGCLINGAVTGIADNAVVIHKHSNSVIELDAVSSDNSGNIQTDGSLSPNTLRIDFWPAVASLYLPMRYVPQFTEIASGDTPAVNDIESRDIGLIAAMRLAPLIGKSSLVPSIAADISQRTREVLDRKLSASVAARQP